MNPRHLEILQHAFGLNKHGQGRPYRNQFVTGPGSDDYHDCCDLVIAGLMTSRTEAPCLAHEDVLFRVTMTGEEYVKTHSPKPPVKKLAWEVEVNGNVCITFAETEPKARWNAVHGYREAYGHRRGVWPSVSARRIEYLDNHSKSQTSGRKCFGYDQL